jgi:GGDEF domain-containing protein
VSVFSDISQLKESAKKLHDLAHHDTLTGQRTGEPAQCPGTLRLY